MQHLGTAVLETARLVLRPFVTADAEAMFRNWAGDPEVTRFLTWPTHPSADVSRMVLTDWNNQGAHDVSCYSLPASERRR